MCEVCGHTFTTLGNKERHIKVVHDLQKDYGCEGCGKKFGYNAQLQTHARVCKGESKGPESEGKGVPELDKIFQKGPELDKFFQAVANILRAKGQAEGTPEPRKTVPVVDLEGGQKTTVKKNVTPLTKRRNAFQCGAQGCGKRFPNRDTLKAHITTDHEKKCFTCGVKFGTILRLTQHVRQSGHDQPRLATNRTNVAQSMREQGKDYKCGACGMTLFSSQKLKMHVMIMHRGKGGKAFQAR